MPTKQVLALRRLTGYIKRLTDQRSRLINQLQDGIVRYCPELVVNWPGGNFACKTMVALLHEHPDIASMAKIGDEQLLEKVQKLSKKQLGRKHAEIIKQAALSLLKVDGVNETEAMIIRDVVEQICDINRRINGTDEKIAELVGEFEVAERLMLLPGISRRIAAVIIAEAGDIRNFPSEGKFATFCGLTPICRQSGQSVGRDRLARQTNKHLLWAMYMAALVSVRCYGPSREYRDRKLQNTPGAYADKIRAAIALARQRCKIIYKILSREGYVYKLKQADQPSPEGPNDVQQPAATNIEAEAKHAGPAKPNNRNMTRRNKRAETALLLQQGDHTLSGHQSMTT